MQKNIAVILAGCGVFDGSEIYESTLTFLNLDQQGASYTCFAPNTQQSEVINHKTSEPMEQDRNVLTEAARLARGSIKDLSELNINNFDAIIVPGGFGVAKNLSNFAFKGVEFAVNDLVLEKLKLAKKALKPIGLICIAPVLAVHIFDKGVKCTIGTDQETANILGQLGAEHVACSATNIVCDESHKLVTTPAYMNATSISEVYIGIQKLVKKVISLCDRSD